MIDLRVDEEGRKRNVRRCREKGILLPTYAQMRDPSSLPRTIRDELKGIGLWEVHSRNLFRISWKNEPVESGGAFGAVNYLELPREDRKSVV